MHMYTSAHVEYRGQPWVSFLSIFPPWLLVVLSDVYDILTACVYRHTCISGAHGVQKRVIDPL